MIHWSIRLDKVVSKNNFLNLYDILDDVFLNKLYGIIDYGERDS